MDAYDYHGQEWVSGIDGARVRLAQLRQELKVLNGPKGEAYLKFTGTKLTLAESLARCRELIRDCEGEIKAGAAPVSVALKIETVPECDHGTATGRTQYNAEAIWPASASWEQPSERAKIVRATLSVLGRGYNEAEAVADWTRRARADGHNVAGELRQGGAS